MTKNAKKTTAAATTNKILVWTVGHQQLLDQARQNDRKAMNMLYDNLHEYLAGVHSHSQDGLYPSKFGKTFNYNGRSYEEASSDVHKVFEHCVMDFSESFGVPFLAYLVNEVKLRAMDWARSRKNDRFLRVGQLKSGDEGECFGEADFEKSCADYYADRSQDMTDSETHPVESLEIADMIRKIFATVRKSGNQKLMTFLECYLECGQGKGAMSEVAERMHVTRAAAYIYLNKVRELLREDFGEFFNTAA